jgi:NNP family nitrate/nitrite transporter-like MFS transporter
VRNRQLVLTTAAFTISFAVWGLISGLAPRFKDLYGLTDSQTALALAGPLLLGSLLRMPVGILADRFGGRVVFTCILAFAVLPSAVIVLCHSYASLLIGGLFLGAAGSSFSAGVSFLSRWFPPEKQGQTLGLFGLGMGGWSIAVYGGPLLASLMPWEAVFCIFAMASLVWAAVFWTFCRDAAIERTAPIRHSVEILATERLSWVLAFFFFVTLGGSLSMSAYLPTLLRGQFGLSLEDAGLRAAVFALLVTAMRAAGGWLADRVGGAHLLAAVFAGVAAFALLLTATDLVVFSAGALGIAVSAGLGNGAVIELVAKHFPREVGAVAGLVGAIGGLGGFFPPIVLGILKQSTGSYAGGFILFSLCALCALMLDIAVFRRPRAWREGAPNSVEIRSVALAGAETGSREEST